MAEHIYIHIGPLKTGTTSLQESLEYNKKTLLDTNILFPGKGLCFKAVDDYLKRGNTWDGDPVNEDCLGKYGEMVEMINSWDKKAVISCEHMSDMTGDEIDQFCRDLKGKKTVIFCYRRASRLLISWWQETTRNGMSFTYNEFLNNFRKNKRFKTRIGWTVGRCIDYPGIVKKWKAGEGVEKIQVMYFPPNTENGNDNYIFKQFDNIIGTGNILSSHIVKRHVRWDKKKLLLCLYFNRTEEAKRLSHTEYHKRLNEYLKTNTSPTEKPYLGRYSLLMVSFINKVMLYIRNKQEKLFISRFSKKSIKPTPFSNNET